MDVGAGGGKLVLVGAVAEVGAFGVIGETAGMFARAVAVASGGALGLVGAGGGMLVRAVAVAGDGLMGFFFFATSTNVSGVGAPSVTLTMMITSSNSSAPIAATQLFDPGQFRMM